MKYFLLLFLLVLSFTLVESVYQYQILILEPIYRFTDSAAVPAKSIYFTNLPQHFSLTQKSSKLDLSQFNVVRGFTQEMFLKNLGCGTDTCQNFPATVTSVYNIIDLKGRLKFETNPAGTDNVLGKAGYLATEEIEGLVRYDEYYSEEDDSFTYTNGKYPNQFGACQLRDYGKLRYKFVRTLGHAFTAVAIPENLPIYSIFAYDDGLPEPTTTVSPTLSPTQYVFETNPIWKILKNSKNGTQGVGAVNLPWTPPVSASPIEPTNVCLLNGNSSVLSRYGEIDRMLQFFDDTHVIIGFKDSIQDASNTFIYSYIGYAFKSSDNLCGIPLKPIRELYKAGVGNTVVAGDDYSDLISSGYMLTGNIIGYTIDCNSTTDGELIVMIPDGISTISSTTILLTSQFATSSPSQIVGYYVQPVKIVGPSASGGEQGYWVDPELPEPQIGDVLGISNVCLFTASSSIISKCGYTRNIYVYYDNVDKFYFVSLYTFGRSVTSKVIGIAFETEENSCGLNLVPIRELYKDRYYVVAGNDYQYLIDDGYNITGNIVGYTVDCKDSKDEFVYGHLPSYAFSTTTSSMTTTASDSTTSDSSVIVSSSKNPAVSNPFITTYSLPSSPNNPFISITTTPDSASSQKISTTTAISHSAYSASPSTIPTTTPYDLTKPLPKLDCNIIENYGDLNGRMVNFANVMEVGDNITITGHIWQNASESTFNLYVGMDPKYLQSYISIHINMRWATDGIVYNYFWGMWNYQFESYSTRPFSRGLPYVLSVVRGINYYDVYGNGQFIKKFGIIGSVALHQVGAMYGYQQWNIDTVKMNCARSHTTTVEPSTPLETASTSQSTPSATLTSTTENIPSTSKIPETSTTQRPTSPILTSGATSTSSSTESTTTSPTTSTTTTLPPTTTPYNLSAPIPKLDCNTIQFYGNLLWRPVVFSRYMEVGDNITLTGFIWNNATESNVNFYLGFNPLFGTTAVPVHISQRWSSSARIIYNNFWGQWGPEAFSARPFTRGQPFVISLIKTANSHQIYGNGQLLINFGYRGTASQNLIGSMIAYRESTIDTVSMACVRPPTTPTTTTSTTTTTTPKLTTTSTLPSTSTAIATTDVSTRPRSCDINSITLGEGDANTPQLQLDAVLGESSGSSLSIYCRGLPNYSIYMMFNVNQGGPPPVIDGYLEITLDCLPDSEGVWTFGGREITAISCFQAPKCSTFVPSFWRSVDLPILSPTSRVVMLLTWQ
ncbi:Putative uncharacterized protein F40H6.5 [Caenorhabditis elegans]|uniref:Putative uncharacterized protein F40H6.5 n=2 Tax=Caenorhabditis elegans TaxID=6239 RepID=YPX5_CAEEL|nr:Putative uncharacterized protein F40H6.5 [Caenorhabditis elegans]Q09277.3 RecName: Full=Putative uncharacterized protein F40H6.5; Flags: Precursor [Caenorhabditis elegans]CCD63188.2 Putative uncharacterized protein F40H6.5 [Caenorhabditis elegans]